MTCRPRRLRFARGISLSTAVRALSRRRPRRWRRWEGLDPLPANLAAGAELAESSPLDFYRRVTVGVAAPRCRRLKPRSAPRIAGRSPLCQYLRLPAPSGAIPPALSAFATTARLSDAQLIAALGNDANGREWRRSVRIGPRGGGRHSGGGGVRLGPSHRGRAVEMSRKGGTKRPGRLHSTRTWFERIERQSAPGCGLGRGQRPSRRCALPRRPVVPTSSKPSRPWMQSGARRAADRGPAFTDQSLPPVFILLLRKGSRPFSSAP
jgi:hypothetical protein